MMDLILIIISSRPDEFDPPVPIETIFSEPSYADQLVWVSALKLATLWEFNGIREGLIWQLSSRKLSISEKILLAMQYKVSNWLLEAYKELVVQPEVPSEDMFIALGYHTVHRIIKLREQSYSEAFQMTRSKKSWPIERTFVGLEEKIKRDFSVELQDVTYQR